MSTPAGARVRWLAAAALAALALSHAWEYLAGVYGTTTLINQYNPYTGDLDLVPYYLPGTPGELVYGYQSPVRIFLLLAIAAALVMAVGTGARLVERVAVGALVAAVVLALSAHEGSMVLTLGLALALVGGRVGRDVSARLRAPAPATG